MFLQIQHCVHKQFLHSHVAFLAGSLIAAGLLLPWFASCSVFCTLLFICCFDYFWSSWTFINEAGGQPHSQGSIWLSVLLQCWEARALGGFLFSPAHLPLNPPSGFGCTCALSSLAKLQPCKPDQAWGATHPSSGRARSGWETWG